MYLRAGWAGHVASMKETVNANNNSGKKTSWKAIISKTKENRITLRQI
jgi:hypothetical protein